MSQTRITIADLRVHDRVLYGHGGVAFTILEPLQVVDEPGESRMQAKVRWYDGSTSTRQWVSPEMEIEVFRP